ncbi:MAG TPA: YetF domain-containing protein [Gemmatimonadaceae bacterium]|nr:YetF domain-containing protein [Gemmatimonadaceae bacterium]
MHTIWTDLIVPGVPLVEKLLRTLAVYVFLLVGLRVAGKRELGQLNPFDLVVLLLLSNTVQNAIIGSDNSLVGGLVGAIVLLVTNYLVVRFLFTHPALDRLVEGDPDLLIRGGRVLEHRLRRELVTREELAAAARRQGFDHLNEVETCRLEVGGALTFIGKHPTTEDTRHREVMARLERIEQALRQA